MFKKYDANVLVFIIIIGLIMIFIGKNGIKDKIKSNLGDYDYSVGKVEVYFSRGTIGHNVGRSSITYSYTVNNIQYILKKVFY